MLKTILFVDEEKYFLNAIKRSLRNMRNEWHVLFASNPFEALQTADNVSVDVLVTGLLFCGQSGLDLLNEMRERHSQAVRIILSGHAGQDLLLKSVDLAHQFLAKTGDDNDLKAAITRAFMVKELLDHEPLRKAVTHINSLPSLPSIYTKLVEELKSEEASIQKVGGIIAEDLGLTTKMLKLVNSSFFGRPQNITDPAKAVSLLGLDLVQAIVLMSSTLDSFKGVKVKGFSIEGLWEHAMTTAALAKNISQNAGMDRKSAETAFMGGMLHDIGKLLIAAHLPEGFSEILQCMHSQKLSMNEAEMDVLGTTHAGIGGYLLGLWGLPCPIVEAAAFHHAPANQNGNGLSPLVIVHVADAFANAGPGLNDSANMIDGIDYELLEKAQLLDHLDQWRRTCHDCLEQKNGKAA
ncbi:MAG: response regulator [Desulfobacteraceae bacterium]|jgi:HD-like signal output (HDOD) protein/ActR/RegA family two-component response regulator